MKTISAALDDKACLVAAFAKVLVFDKVDGSSEEAGSSFERDDEPSFGREV